VHRLVGGVGRVGSDSSDPDPDDDGEGSRDSPCCL
jgi:hypothetical protein